MKFSCSYTNDTHTGFCIKREFFMTFTNQLGFSDSVPEKVITKSKGIFI